MVMCIKSANYFNAMISCSFMLYLDKEKWHLQKRNWCASQILWAVKRSTENVKIASSLLFFLGNHWSTHDSGIKRASCSSFKMLVRSPRRSRPNARMPTTSERAYVTSRLCFLRRSRHVGNVIYSTSVESSPNDVIIIHTHSEVIVAFPHGSQV
jgi:hypothetical protein